LTDEAAKDPETERRLAELKAEVATREAALAKLRADVDMLLAAREASNKDMKELWEETKQRDREALARPLRPSPPLRLWSDLWGEIGELRDEIRAGFATCGNWKVGEQSPRRRGA
jgi:hypothetical protein